jgi:hypothetical protein
LIERRVRSNSKAPAANWRPGFCRAEYKKDFWQAELTTMIKLYGAPIDGADVPRIVEYFAATC